MPRSMQEKITAHLELLAESHKDVDLSVKASAGNTGRLYAQRGFDTLVEVAYDFQPAYASFALSGRLVERIDVYAQPWKRWIGIAPHAAKRGATDEGKSQLTFHHARYGSQEDLEGVFGLFDALLDSADEPAS